MKRRMNKMTKIMCDCIECLHNPSNIIGTSGECMLEETKVVCHEYLDGESEHYEDVPKCNNFEWAHKAIVYHKEVKKKCQ